MTHTIGLIHAVIPAMPPVREAFAQLLPDVRVLNILDEALLKEAERLGQVVPTLVRRMTSLVALHEASGAELVLFTCTAYSPYAEQVQAQAAVPVVPIDQALLETALSTGRRLGVLATVEAGLEQQSKSIDRAAEAAGLEVELTKVLRADAFRALNSGDAETHDRILLEELERLAPVVDVVVLAQASMAGLMDKLSADLMTPVLSSPRLAVEKVKETLGL